MNELLDEIPETELPGGHVVLRPLHEPDAAVLYRLIDSSREHLGRFLPWPPDCRSEEDVVRRAASGVHAENAGPDGQRRLLGCFRENLGRF